MNGGSNASEDVLSAFTLLEEKVKRARDILRVPNAASSRPSPLAGGRNSSVYRCRAHLTSAENVSLLRTVSWFPQVGLFLNGLRIDSMVVGGPAYNSGLLDVGDVIVSIDGEEATEGNVEELVIGDDQPGSLLEVSVLKVAPVGASVRFD